MRKFKLTKVLSWYYVFAFFIIFGLAVYLYRSFFRFREGAKEDASRTKVVGGAQAKGRTKVVGGAQDKGRGVFKVWYNWKDCNEKKLPYEPSLTDVDNLDDEWWNNMWNFYVDDNPDKDSSEDAKLKFIASEKIRLKNENDKRVAQTEAQNNYCTNKKNNNTKYAENSYKTEMDEYDQRAMQAKKEAETAAVPTSAEEEEAAVRVAVGRAVDPEPKKRGSIPKKTRRSPKTQSPKRKYTPYKSKSKKYKVGDKVMVENNRATIITKPTSNKNPNTYKIKYDDNTTELVDVSLLEKRA